MNRFHHALFAFTISLFVAGCSTSYSIRIVDGLPKEVYLNFSKGANIKIGDLFVQYAYHSASTSSSVGGHQGHAGHGETSPSPAKHEVGVLKVVRIVDETHALVEVVSGQVQEGLETEKLR